MTSGRKSIRHAIFLRCRYACEHCGLSVTEESGHMDHFWGRGAGRPAESTSTTWFLCQRCDQNKTVNRPSNTVWLERYRAHCIRHDLTEELERIEARIQWNTAKGLT